MKHIKLYQQITDQKLIFLFVVSPFFASPVTPEKIIQYRFGYTQCSQKLIQHKPLEITADDSITLLGFY